MRRSRVQRVEVARNYWPLVVYRVAEAVKNPPQKRVPYSYLKRMICRDDVAARPYFLKRAEWHEEYPVLAEPNDFRRQLV